MSVYKIAAVIVTYKFSEKKLNKLRESLMAQGIKESNIFQRDNSLNNLGYGEGINRILIKELDNFDAFLILNPDISLKKNAITGLIDKAFSDKKIGIVGPKILTTREQIWSIGGNLDKKRFTGGLIQYSNSKQIIDFISGTCFLIKTGVFKKIGLFRTDYFLYYEDVDFCLRAKRNGFLIEVEPKSVIIHEGSLSVGKNSPTMHYYMARNHLLFVERFAPTFVILREFVRLPKTIFQAKGRPYELLGIWDYFLRRFGRNNKIQSAADLS